LFIVFQTPPEATATKYLAEFFGSTANPMTLPEVNPGPIKRNRRPLNVGDDMGSAGFFSSSGFLSSAGFSGDPDADGDGDGVGDGDGS
jgi:hypothetical protein